MILYIKYIFTVFVLIVGQMVLLPCVLYSKLTPPKLFSFKNDCSALDSIPILNFDFQEYSETGDFNFVYGNRREDLSDKVMVNGSSSLEETIFEALQKELGQSILRLPSYRNLEINFLLNKKGKVEHIFLTNELFWYFDEPGFGKQVDNLNFDDPEEIEMAANLFDFMTQEEIQEVKRIVINQRWKAGKCNGKRVDTIITLDMKTSNLIFLQQD